jgi:hypothetical protein
MRKLFGSKRRLAVVGAITALALAGGGSAFAYFTSSGTGTGSGTVGSSSGYAVVVSTPTGGPLVPGGATETFTYNVTNNSTGSQEFTTETITVTDANPNCLASWYSVSGTGIATPGNPATQTVTQTLAGGATGAAITFTLSLINEPVNQDTCESDTPSVSVAVS